ncbi:hypothetical protein FNV43_RR04181 [Rhamnella rubrinervis]|uniref:EF-hand domain-containing protein n=1 Tax=Rhamnella rubrinervis TaxID=2594499 RepID=A0A8K0MQC6_9ROSA|nr:hypothetical protein FNV43_RR04181 [Rhamnella rubrinervis]
MVLTTILLLAVLFIAGLVNVYFYLPNTKVFAWIQSLFSATASNTNPSLSSSSRKEMRNTEKKTDELRQIFATFDKNSDGFITKQELRESLKNIRIFMTDTEVEEMVLKVDSNGDGLIDFEEFCLLCEALIGTKGGSGGESGGKDGKGSYSGADDEEELKEAFDVFDKDKDGLISVDELALVLCSLGLTEGKKMEDCKEMIKKVDMDGDGMVNFDEFKKMMKGGGSSFLLTS